MGASIRGLARGECSERRTITVEEEGERRQRLPLSLNEHCSDGEHEKESLKDHAEVLVSLI